MSSSSSLKEVFLFGPNSNNNNESSNSTLSLTNRPSFLLPSTTTMSQTNIDLESGESIRPSSTFTIPPPQYNETFSSRNHPSSSPRHFDIALNQQNSSTTNNESQSLLMKNNQNNFKSFRPKIIPKQRQHQSLDMVITNGNDNGINDQSRKKHQRNKSNNRFGATIGNFVFPIRKWNGNHQTAPAIENNNNTVTNMDNKQQQARNNNQQMVELIWRNLTYTVSHFKWKSFLKEKGYSRKRLLNSISGSMRAGELMAIMGPSGAGKTTMIECIAGRRKCGVSGDILVTNCTKRTKLAYMAQEDAFMPCLTVFETLLFASKLRNYQRNNKCKVKLVDDNENVYNATTYPDPNLIISLPNETYHRNLVNQIIHKLGLDQCRNVKAENCSGGQQKRLCIALELIHSPTILILDEPTSGLDSVSCLQCVNLLRELAHNPEQPMAIAASIHQPTARILQNFDRLYVLAQNGQCMYDGPTDQLVPYLVKYKLSCPTYHNPADFILEIATGDYGQEVINELVSAQAFQHKTGCLIRYPSPNNITNKIEDKKDVEEIVGNQESDCIEELRLWPESCSDTVSIGKICQRSRKQVKRREFYKTMILWMRCMMLSFRDPTEYLLRIFATVSIILLNVILYNDSKMGQADGCSQDTIMHMVNTIRSDYDGNQSFSLANSLLEGPGALAILNFGYIFFAMTFCTFLAMMPTILTFPLEVAVFYKEYFNGWYSFSSYFLAKNLTNILPSVVLPILYGVTTYLITNQYWETWRFIYFIMLLLMISMVADGVGITISAIFVHNVNAASIFAATSQIPLLLFTGFLVQIDQLPRLIQPLTYLSYYRLFFESAVIVFYGHGRCPQPEPFDLKRIRSLMGDDVEEMMDCVWQNTNFFDSSQGPSLTDRLERILTVTENQNPSLILQNFRLNEKDLPFLMCLLGSYAIISRIIAYIVLYRKANARR